MGKFDEIVRFIYLFIIVIFHRCYYHFFPLSFLVTGLIPRLLIGAVKL